MDLDDVFILIDIQIFRDRSLDILESVFFYLIHLFFANRKYQLTLILLMLI